MTFPDDFIRLNLTIGTKTIPLKNLGLEWPPPERLYLGPPGGPIREALKGDDEHFVLVRRSYSHLITDEMRAGMSHVARGAEYVYIVREVTP